VPYDGLKISPATTQATTPRLSPTMQADSADLVDALSTRPVNLLRVKTLCRVPGVISSSGMRVRVWSLLLGLDEEADSEEEELETPEAACEEQHVLEADVKRTRAEIEQFRSATWRKALKDILQTFSLMQNTPYRQGMNELLAPFIFLLPPESPRGSRMAYTLFQHFVYRYLERFLLTSDSGYLFKSFRLFDILLHYHDPQLAVHLSSSGITPELYAPAWFLTAFSRALSIQQVLRLWDLLIAVDDPAFIFFVGLRLICHNRTALLNAQPELIVEKISEIAFQSEDEIDAVVAEALVLYNSTPRSFCKFLRLCCVSTHELTPTSSAQKERMQKAEGKDVLDEAMVAQAEWCCCLITPRECVDHLTPHLEGGRPSHVLLDVRSALEARDTGGGFVVGAVCVEPEFLQQEDKLNIWLQHMDKFRDAKICVVDSGPPARASSVALWKRLLFGEGDGQAMVSYSSSSGQKKQQGPFFSASTLWGAAGDGAEDGGQSERAAVTLARALQSQSFPNVAVLDGGYPALIEHLLSSRATVEPFIEAFDFAKWNTFREAAGAVGKAKKAKKGGEDEEDDVPDVASIAGAIFEQLTGLSELEKRHTALRVAIRLKHTHMAGELEQRI